VAIANETVFSVKAAKQIQTGGILLLSDAAFFFIGNVTLALLNMNNPGILLLSLLGDMFVLALGVLAAVLSRYITKAAVLQEENEGTL
jgi:ABC-type branched-subunit amino acid transport system permease subunit